MNGKRKGNKNERALTKWWEEWLGLEFQRVPQSGGLRWNNRDNISGDIICTDPRKGRRFPFTIETKFHKDINFSHLLLNVKGNKIFEFWKQVTEDGIATGKTPILFMRYNGMPKLEWFVAIDGKLYKRYFQKYEKGIPELKVIKYNSENCNLVILNSKELLQYPGEEIIKKIKLDKWKKRL